MIHQISPNLEVAVVGRWVGGWGWGDIAIGGMVPERLHLQYFGTVPICSFWILTQKFDTKFWHVILNHYLVTIIDQILLQKINEINDDLIHNIVQGVMPCIHN